MAPDPKVNSGHSYTLNITDASWHRVSEDSRTLKLAREYKAACAKVQPAWIELLKVAAKIGHPERAERQRAYHEAVDNARKARELLVDHASGGVLEVGR